jgi:predicted enzyme related to lactoylglutathione lyase
MSTTAAGTEITGMDLCAYFTQDPDRSIAFYRDVLGITPTAISPGQGSEFTLADGQTFGVWKPDEGETLSGGAVMFAVGDANAAVERFRANGAQIQDVVETPVCFMAPGVDPDGNVFIIHQRKTAD